MQISLTLIQSINHAKLTICIKSQFLVTFNSLFTGSSSLSVFPRGVLYLFSGYINYLQSASFSTELVQKLWLLRYVTGGRGKTEQSEKHSLITYMRKNLEFQILKKKTGYRPTDRRTVVGPRPKVPVRPKNHLNTLPRTS